MKVVVIIPTYNEKGNIEKMVEILEKKVFPAIKDHSMKILVADDNSPDGTGDVVKELVKKHKNIELVSGERKGLGAAYIRAMSYAIEKMDADAMFEMDADGQHDPTKIPEFLKKMDEGFDMVIGTRYSGGGSIPENWPLNRKIFSIFGNLLVRIILLRPYIHDWTGGYRLLRKEVFLKEKKELLNYNGYIFQISFLHKAVVDKFTVAEVPFHFSDRTLGRSKIASFNYIIDVLSYVIRARIYESMHSPFLKYGITGFFGYLINAISLEYFFHQGLHPAAAAAIGAELSIIFNFVVNNFWAFSEHRITNPWKVLLKFPQFNLISLGSLVIITTVIWAGTHLFGEQTRQIFLVIAIGLFVIPYSYTMYNIFIWKRWRIGFLAKIQDKLG